MTDSNVKLTQMAREFDELTAELSVPEDWQKLAEWVADTVLGKGGGLDSAKMLILSTLIADDKYSRGYLWSQDLKKWYKPNKLAYYEE